MLHAADEETSSHHPVLPTYLLKVAFLKEVAQYPEEGDWEQDGCHRLFHILDTVEKDGADRKMTSYDIKDEPLLIASDKPYREVPRIRQCIKETAIHCAGIPRRLLLSAICFCLLGIATVSTPSGSHCSTNISQRRLSSL